VLKVTDANAHPHLAGGERLAVKSLTEPSRARGRRASVFGYP
jgi:hypothetical protein